MFPVKAAGSLQIQKFLLQLLVNMAASSPTCSQRIWAQLFPDRLAALAEASQEETAGPLCVLLLLITKNTNACANSLCTQLPSLLNPLLDSISRNTEHTAAAGTLGLLIQHVILQQGLLQTAMITLAKQQGSGGRDRTQHPLCRQQVVLLQLLAAELEAPAGSSTPDALHKLDDSVQFLLYWVHAMSARHKQHKTNKLLATQNLEAGLQVLRALTSLEESVCQPIRLANDQLIRMLVCTLAMLAALNPIQPPRRRKDPRQPAPPQPCREQDITSGQPQEVNNGQADAVCDDVPSQKSAEPPNEDGGQAACCSVEQALSQQTADSAEELLRLAEQYPKQSPYTGYRCDLVALLANLCFQCPAVQHKVQQLGGVELILSQCQWDDENPLVREYGLWAVRNLCEGNESIQESISGLRACSTVDSPDLQQIGMQLELDGQTGKPTMVDCKT
ncbi:hypothetical protein ABBQ32_013419 [Trebouxia sp. C0010 RCD-2024]